MIGHTMFIQRLRVVKPARIEDPYSPGRLTLDLHQGATIAPGEWLVECQPATLVEDTAGGTRIHTTTSWRVITRPGEHIAGLQAVDGVLVDGIDGVLQVEGEIGGWAHPRLGHDEFTVRRSHG